MAIVRPVAFRCLLTAVVVAVSGGWSTPAAAAALEMFPSNEYEYSLRRVQLVADERNFGGRHQVLSEVRQSEWRVPQNILKLDPGNGARRGTRCLLLLLSSIVYNVGAVFVIGIQTVTDIPFNIT